MEIKTRRAQEHFAALQLELDRWLQDPTHYTVREYDDFDNAQHIFKIEIGFIPEIIPMLLGDFVCCLRSSLDQLAWALAHLPPVRTFTGAEEREIHFPIAHNDNSQYRRLLSLFPPAATDILDSFQPYRGGAYRNDPLWQLNELWTMDKHKAIPMNSSEIKFVHPFKDWTWRRRYNGTDYYVEVIFPVIPFYSSEINYKPRISVEVLFGEHMGEFTVSRARLGEINDFVRNKVIPRFTGFFS